MNCSHCAGHMMMKINVKGRTFPYKRYSNIILDKDLFLWVCNKCNDMLLNGDDCKIIDDIMEEFLKKNPNYTE